jgi:diaminohydroxyphosphoribosylaminopyrimidine deaminase/5-amino-6-(5-phosphoribosylamino)uracil reductase
MPHPFSSSDEQWMAHALALARRGEALASPNPMVGAVLVRNQRVVGEGFHTYDALKHAEIIALEAAGSAARRATLYVNLEPCCITGRTGPCTQALIQGGVARVVAAMPDPNPAVSGRGFKKMRAAGIEVEAGNFSEEARRLNEAFAMWITTRRPLVTLKSAMTLDGSLVLPGAAAGSSNGRRPQWITSSASRAEVQRMRHASDALVTGIGTILADDPMLTDRTGLPRRRPLLRVVLDSRLRLSARSRLVREAHEDVIVFTCAAEKGRRARALRRAGVEVVTIGERTRQTATARPDLRAVLEELGHRNITSVLLEAGPTLNAAAVGAGIVDKVRMFYAPKLAGGPLATSRYPSLARSLALPQKAPAGHEISHLRIEQFGADFAVEGYLHDVYGNY